MLHKLTISLFIQDAHLWDHSFSTYAKYSEIPAFLTPWYAHVSAYQGVINVSFSENFVYILNQCLLNLAYSSIV